VSDITDHTIKDIRPGQLFVDFASETWWLILSIVPPTTDDRQHDDHRHNITMLRVAYGVMALCTYDFLKDSSAVFTRQVVMIDP
jgi:hypothetical protein